MDILVDEERAQRSAPYRSLSVEALGAPNSADAHGVTTRRAS
jgi:hypothetical protein